MTVDLRRRMLAEALGTGLLVIAVIGSGIAAERLSPGQPGLQLLVNAVATTATLVALLLALGPISGAHLNPVVSVAARGIGVLGARDVTAYVGAQVAGGICGAVTANVMFSLPPIRFAGTPRSSGGLWLAEMVATFGLVLVVCALVDGRRSGSAPYAVAAYIGGACFFTASTGFANPAVTLARTLSDTFAGIAPASAPAFVVAQVLGGTLGTVAVRALTGATRVRAS